MMISSRQFSLISNLKGIRKISPKRTELPSPLVGISGLSAIKHIKMRIDDKTRKKTVRGREYILWQQR